MRYQKFKFLLGTILFLSLPLLGLTVLNGCGKSTGVTLQTNPLTGANQGSLYHRSHWQFALRGFDFFKSALGLQTSFASVSPFNTFNVCVSEVVWELASGSAGNSSSAPLVPGLLTFSPTSTSPMNLGKLDIAEGSSLKNIKFTISTKPEVCAGADYAVLFNSNSSGGDKKVTQDVSFKFEFSSNYTVGADSTITVFLGDIVNALVALGTNLSNSTFQGIMVGQAR